MSATAGWASINATAATACHGRPPTKHRFAAGAGRVNPRAQNTAALCRATAALGGVLTHSLPPLLATQAAGLAGTIAVIGLAALCQRVGALARPLVTLGQASMAVYVSHTIASAGMRIALRLLGVAPDSPLSLVACVLAGLGGPLVLWYLAGAQPWGRWVGLGALPAARPEPRAAAAG